MNYNKFRKKINAARILAAVILTAGTLFCFLLQYIGVPKGRLADYLFLLPIVISLMILSVCELLLIIKKPINCIRIFFIRWFALIKCLYYFYPIYILNNGIIHMLTNGNWLSKHFFIMSIHNRHHGSHSYYKRN